MYVKRTPFNPQTLYQAEVECRDYDVMYTKLLEKPDPGSSIYEFNEENQDLYDYLSKYIGQVRGACCFSVL